MDSVPTCSQEANQMECYKKKDSIDILMCRMDGITLFCNLDLNNLPPWSKTMVILKQTNAELRTWIKLSMEYDKKGDTNGFVKLLENARKHATVNYQNNEKDQVQVRKMLVKCYAETGNVAFIEHDNNRALSYYRKAMNCHPNSALIRVAIATCFSRLGNLEEARNSYLEAIHIDGKCISALLGVGVIQIQLGNEDEGAEYFRKAYIVDKTNPIVLNQVANHSFSLKLYDQCKLLAQHALQNTVDRLLNSKSSFILGRAYHAQGEYEKAFEYYKKSTMIGPKTFVLPLYGLGKMYLHRGEMEKAIKCFKKILHHHPGDIDTLRILGFLYAISETNYVKINIGKLYLKKVTDKCPTAHESWLKLAELCKVSDPEVSLEAYNKAFGLIRRSKNSYIAPVVLNNVGVVLYKLKRFNECIVKLEESLAVLNEIVITDPERRKWLEVTITYNLARVHDELLNYEMAVKLYRIIIRTYPNYVDGYLRMGVIADRLKKINKAGPRDEKVLKVDSRHVDALQSIRKLRADVNTAINASDSVPTERERMEPKHDDFDIDIFDKSTDTTLSKSAVGVVETTTHESDSQVNKNQRTELKKTINY